MTRILKPGTLVRRGVVATAFVVLIGGAHTASAQPKSMTRPQATVDEAAELEKRVETLYGQGKFGEAVPLAKRSLSLREKALGRMHPDVAQSLNNLAELYKAQGAPARAEPLHARALDIREKALGPIHPDVAESLNNLAGLYWAQGEYARAEPLYVRALGIREKVLGPMHPDVAISLHDLALLYEAQGAYARAEPLYVRALGIWEKALGPMHRNVATSLSNLALLYWAQGAYARAEPLYVRALDIREKALGQIHPDVAESLNNLAELHREQGAYARAEPLHVRALAIREKALGPMHPVVAQSLNNLALLYRDQGAYARAEPLYVRALDIWEKALGPMHPDVANSANNLAELYQAQGAYMRAEPLYLRALDIREKALGPMHPNVAQSLNNLAGLYQAQAAYARAEPLFVRALAIWEKALGPMHPDVANSLNNLAALYWAQGAYARAEPLFVRALAIREKALGPMHPNVANSLANLATLYRAQGAYARAEPLYVRALDIWEKTLGPMHPDVATSLNNLALLYEAQGTYARAEPLYVRAAEIREAYLRIELARLSASRKRDLMTPLQGDTERLVSFHAHSMPASSHALDLALTTVLRRKARVLDSLADNRTRLRAHLAPALRDKLDKLAEANAEISTRLRIPFDPRTAATNASAIAALRTRIDELEAALNAASAKFRSQSEPVTVAKVQAALPRGAVLVEFVRYRRFDARQPQHPSQEERYLAYVLPWQGAPQWVALGDAAAIESRVDAVLAAMHKDSGADATRKALRDLDALVFAPIRRRLVGVSHVVLSPDGKLNLVPFEALIDEQGRYVVEQRLVSYVTSGRDLLRLAARSAPQSAASIVAAPDYGPGKPFVALTGMTAEAKEIQGYFRHASLLTAGKATRQALAAVVGPAFLHIATHGFYARAATSPWKKPVQPPPSERGVFLDVVTPPPRSDDPADALDRAGLALAGANVRPDGIVSAREIAGFDWWGTRLVVLSACETGVGAVPSGEGVYGMRRALVLAGAESQVVSLWNVSDSSASELMREFYGELAHGTGRAEALRRAKLSILGQKRFAHPYYWAPFILAGDWKPLDRNTIRRVGGRAL